MWSCEGKSINIKQSVIGIITRKKKVLFPKKYIYLKESIDEDNPQYSGIVTGQQETTICNTPAIVGVNQDDLNHLKEGDVVLLEPEGKINVLWDINSPHNAILTTNVCNCSCVMCPQPRCKDADDHFELILKLVDLINPKVTKRIGITGGEPTLIGDDLFKLILTLKLRFPSASVLLLSNGRMFKDFDFVKKLIDVGHPNLTVGIPIYSDNDREHDQIVGVKGSFYETIKGLMNLALFNQKIEIRNVMISQNCKRMPQYAQFIYRNLPFVIHIAFMGMEVTGLALKNLKKIWVEPVGYMKQLTEAVVYLNRRDMKVSIYNLQQCILPVELWSYSRKSISTWKNSYIKECEPCDYINDCCGFFTTSGQFYSQHIHAIKK